MSYFLKSSLVAVLGLGLTAGQASAQFYDAAAEPQSRAHSPGGIGLDLGLRGNGFNPNVGAGIGPIGAGVGAGLGQRGIGAGVNAGVGPIGGSVDAGIGRNGLGARGDAGFGNTGAAFEGGISRGGVGVGASAKVLNVGAGASVGIGKRGPGLGASLAFGNFGTLLIGSHRNSHPGAKQTAAYTDPYQNLAYYTSQNYGNAPYYRPAPVQHPSYAYKSQTRSNRGQVVSYQQPRHVIYYPQNAQPSYAPVTYARPAYVQPAYAGSGLRPAASAFQTAPTACPARWTC